MLCILHAFCKPEFLKIFKKTFLKHTLSKYFFFILSFLFIMYYLFFSITLLKLPAVVYWLERMKRTKSKTNLLFIIHLLLSKCTVYMCNCTFSKWIWMHGFPAFSLSFLKPKQIRVPVHSISNSVSLILLRLLFRLSSFEASMV